eukprot:511713_1
MALSTSICDQKESLKTYSYIEQSNFLVYGYIGNLTSTFTIIYGYFHLPNVIKIMIFEFYLPEEYRVVIHPGVLVNCTKELNSRVVGKLVIGTRVVIQEVDSDERRARLISPIQGWCSIYSYDGRIKLQEINIKSALMDKAIHAERARQIKIMILKEITFLNKYQVIEVLTKTCWDLTRCIQAFYIAKYRNSISTICQNGGLNDQYQQYDKKVCSEREKQTKIMILQKITKVNEATGIFYLEKASWNLRRSLELFFITKYKKDLDLQKNEKKEKPTESKVGWWKSWKKMYKNTK